MIRAGELKQRIELQCQACGNSIEKPDPRRRFCYSCSAKRDSERKKQWAERNHDQIKQKQDNSNRKKREFRSANPKYFVCVVCGAQGVKHGNQKQCTGDCRRKTRAHRERFKHIPKTQRTGGKQTCFLCGCEMTLTIHNRKYCDDCRKIMASHYERKRNITKRGASGTHTRKEFNELCDRMKWECEYCGKSLNIKTATEDHIVPLAMGGSNDIENIAIACLSCNTSKGKQAVDKFMERKCYAQVN